MEEDFSESTERVAPEEQVCLCFNLRRAARVVTQIYDDMMRPLGYRATQIQLLTVVSQFAPATVNRLAKITETDRTTLTRNLKLLEKDDLVQIKRGQDRRERKVEISEHGRQVLLTAYPVWQKIQEQIASAAGRARLDRFQEDLETVMTKIQGR